MKYRIALMAALALAMLPAWAQSKKAAAKPPAAKAAQAPAAEVKDAATLEFEKFRAEMEDSNPAELFEMKGEEQWKSKRGPKNVSLAESCDLGLGIGKIEGAYVRMPRYFADADAVMDAERRIVWCMVEKQGFKFDDIASKPFANANFTPDITNLVTYVAGHSRNMKLDVPLKDPKVREAYEIGKEIAAYRAGPYDFSCNTCHGSDGKRIRMQNLPNLSTPQGALKGVQGWPGYRMTGGVMLTHQWRMGDCFRQQRFPQPKYASDAVAYLLTYMIGNANGQVYKGPGIKR
ncbi:sulfur oxidation c-type cytochrome SoxA [Sulfuritalea hydrogenivorans]|uniref:L-cysteine S-thiosulfotransferase subunit SoxA n=1 Tax=Sulfuritalea hydrogenivorans sk43H TaxID=1223802 RepID=W0SI65_9PROT|nr:sulfur oxidation c-type cytochrome SoxA [Sulfuritalea hydrogenivorans]MDK9714125.1 sulfur oxidation c-type cytochrome SoxA [Sulfuritalea sp.]BAO30507.1 sulfur oxidation protein soxA [Sulfuritalea hydrogenivorans sk43H]